MAMAAFTPYPNVVSSLNLNLSPKSPQEKIDEITEDTAKKKAEIDQEFRDYAAAQTNRRDNKLEAGLFHTDKTPRNVSYRTELRIRKRYWSSEWKKEKIQWKADRRIAKLRGEDMPSFFSLKVPTSPTTGMTLNEMRERWHLKRESDLIDLHSDYEDGRPIQQKYFPPTAPIASPAPMWVATPAAQPPVPQTPPVQSPMPERPPAAVVPPVARPAEPAPAKTTFEMPEAAVEAPRPVSQSPKETVPAEKSSDKLQRVVSEIHDSMAQLQASLDRALQVMNEQKREIAEDRVHLIYRRTELAKRDGKLKENTEALHHEQDLLEADQTAYGQKAILRDKKKETLTEAKSALVADRKTFEDQVDRWEVQQRQINAKIKEFHENAAEISQLRADVESEKVQIAGQEAQVTKQLGDIDAKRGQLETERNDLKMRAEVLDSEIAGLDTQTNRVMNDRDDIAQRRADLAKRQKDFVDQSMDEWNRISAEAALDKPSSHTSHNINEDKKDDDNNPGVLSEEEVSSAEKIEGTKDAPAEHIDEEEHNDAQPDDEKKSEEKSAALDTTIEDATSKLPGEIEEKVPVPADPVEDAAMDIATKNNEPRPVQHDEHETPTSAPAEAIAEKPLVIEQGGSDVPEAAPLLQPTQPHSEEPVKSRFQGLKSRLFKSISAVKEEPPAKDGPIDPPHNLPQPEAPANDDEEAAPAPHQPNPEIEPALAKPAASGSVRDILYETKENIKNQTSGKFEATPHETGGLGSAMKQKFAQARVQRNAVKAKREETAQEVEVVKAATAQEIAKLLKNGAGNSLLKTDDAVVAKLVDKLIDSRVGREIVQQYKRSQKEATQTEDSNIIFEGMQVTAKNMRISMSNAGGRMRYAAGKARCVSLTCTEGVGRLVSAAARSRLTQQKLPEETFELR